MNHGESYYPHIEKNLQLNSNSKTSKVLLSWVIPQDNDPKPFKALYIRERHYIKIDNIIIHQQVYI